MARRINSRTGYPMSTEKQINKARENLKFVTDNTSTAYDQAISVLTENGIDNRSDKEKLHDYMINKFGKLINLTKAKAELAYKLGEWDTSENQYIKIFYLDVLIAEKLRIIYQKEKRFNDAYFIMNLTKDITSDLPDSIGKYNNWIYEKFNHNLENVKKKAASSHLKDKSLLDDQRQFALIKEANSTLNVINNLEKQYKEANHEN